MNQISLLERLSYPPNLISVGQRTGKTNVTFLEELFLKIGWQKKGIGKSSLLAVNNAGLTALSLADFVSPGAILLVGMDLAGGGDGSIRYAKNTGRSNIEIDTNIFHEIPGNYSETVTTPFFSDWQETSDASALTVRKGLSLI